MRQKIDAFTLIIFLLSGVVVLFILFPLGTTIFTNEAGDIHDALTDLEVLRAMGITFTAAGIAMVIGVFGGVPLAFTLARKDFPGKAILEGIINLPLVIPHTAAGIAILMVFGRNGVFGRILEDVGIFFTDRISGIVVAMIFVGIPYLINTSREAFNLMDPELDMVAQTDGASNWQCFWMITLPNVWRAILSGMVMMWARGVSEFGAVAIIAYNPKTVPVLIFERFQGFGLKNAQPIAAILIITSLVVFFLIKILYTNRDTSEKRGTTS